jgi:hypothetical protein
MQKRVFVAREQPEQHPVGQFVGPSRAGHPELEQAPVLWDGSDVLDAVLGGRRQAEEVPPPDPVVLLLLDDRLGLFRLEDRRLFRRDQVG